MGNPPKCAQHGAMELQKPGTPEQAWAGVWYRYRTCTNTTLVPSKEVVQLAAAAAQGGDA